MVAVTKDQNLKIVNLKTGRTLHDIRGSFEITDVLNHYIDSGGLFWRLYDGQWTDAGTVASLLRAADFMKVTSVISFTKQALQKLGPQASRLARLEGLTAHAHAVDIRLKR